ncbi:hypothetical protein J2S43_002600 [Catenuloplanes nepalensis]|uniref:Uncharacterized protein n=1 Tax=Catenuloplanes nepalensis TaxID=587533 RepID=A0ABT9MS53_9ACTN|nr:hypothetical protein [Catenuloplanes nepalensis]MDP9794088.1 hypothetical protein [Catenuloplanes nepalensis]
MRFATHIPSRLKRPVPAHGVASATDGSAYVGNRDLDLIRTVNPRPQPLEDRLTARRAEVTAAL